MTRTPVAAISSAPAATAVSVVAPAIAAQPAASSAGLDSVVNPLFGADPQSPVQSPVSWVVLAAARRERGSQAFRGMPQTVVSTDYQPETEAVELTRTVAPPAAALAASTGSPQALTSVASATADNPIGAFVEQIQAFVTQIVQAVTQVITQVVQTITQAVTAVVNVFIPTPTPVPVNAAPIASTPTVGTPDAVTGLVTGQIIATDPNGDTLTYSAPATTGKGDVAINASTGAFIYTPTATARQNAAQGGTAAADTFTVTVTDGKGGITTVSVNVVISPAAQEDNPTPQPTNRTPIAGIPVAGTPNASTGVVIGSVTATDADGDTLTYSGSTTTSKGNVAVAANGTFTYSPTATARHAAAQIGATTSATTDSFTVTVADGRGGTATIPVTVLVSPINIAPVAGNSTVGTPNASTGVVTGTLLVTDPDGDTLTYSAAATTAKGSVSVNTSTGAFTYTPTLSARQAATPTTTDTFTVTVTDGYGGSVDVPVIVVVGPTAQINRAPVAGTPTVGIPDASTGVVAGSVVATDADGDTLVYTGSTTTSKGTVIVAADGSFTYTPNADARPWAQGPIRNSSGVNATSMAFSVDGTRAYVAGSGESSWRLRLLDTVNNILLSPLAGLSSDGFLGGVPADEGVAISRDGTRVYAIGRSYNPNSIYRVDRWLSVVDTGSNYLINRLPLPGGSGGGSLIALSPDGSRAYFIDGGFSVIDTATGAQTFLGSSGLVALNFDRTRAYIAYPADNRLDVIDTANGSAISTISGLFANTSKLAVSPDGSLVYLATSNNGLVSISVIDTSTGTVTRSITLSGQIGPSKSLVVSPDGTRLYVATSASPIPLPGMAGISVIDTATASVLKTITGFNNAPEIVGITPDATRAYLSLDAISLQLSRAEWINVDPNPTDTFTMAIADGRGGSVSIPVTVPVG